MFSSNTRIAKTNFTQYQQSLSEGTNSCVSQPNHQMMKKGTVKNFFIIWAFEEMIDIVLYGYRIIFSYSITIIKR